MQSSCEHHVPHCASCSPLYRARGKRAVVLPHAFGLLSRSQRLWQGAGAVHRQHLSLHPASVDRRRHNGILHYGLHSFGIYFISELFFVVFRPFSILLGDISIGVYLSLFASIAGFVLLSRSVERPHSLRTRLGRKVN